MNKAKMKDWDCYVYADKYNKSKEQNLICPMCGEKVIYKDCDDITRISHFAHKSVKDCEGWTKPMTQYHIDFQNKFDRSNQEIIVIEDVVKHRADIKINDTIIEIQATKITNKNILKRNTFYSKNNRLIWVIYVKEPYDKGNIGTYSDHIYWKYRWNTIFNYAMENVELYLHFEKTDSQGDDMLFYVSKKRNPNDVIQYQAYRKRIYGYFITMEYFVNNIVNDRYSQYKVISKKYPNGISLKDLYNNDNSYYMFLINTAYGYSNDLRRKMIKYYDIRMSWFDEFVKENTL